jgi:hypothetical protein
MKAEVAPHQLIVQSSSRKRGPIAGFKRFAQRCLVGQDKPMVRTLKNSRKSLLIQEMRTAIAQILLHPPVNVPHSLENQADRATHFLLTTELKGVKP